MRIHLCRLAPSIAPHLRPAQSVSWPAAPPRRTQPGHGFRDVNGDQIPDLFVSDTSAGNVELLKGVGSGFFNDVKPTTYVTGANPGPLFVDNFTIASHDIGALVRALIYSWDQDHEGDWTDRVGFLPAPAE